MAGDVETKLSAARTRLILDKPFLGALVLRLPMTKADPKWCKTTATDARKFYYNEQYIDSLTLDQTQFMLAHEALHCALSHFARREHRIKHHWDVACDYAVNPLLLKDGLKAPAGSLYLAEFDGMTAEEIYPQIDDLDDEPETLDQHMYDNDEPDAQSGSSGDQEQKDNKKDQQNQQQPQDQDEEGGGQSSEAELDPNRGGAPQPKPLTAAEKEQLQIQWQQRLAGAAQQAMQAGKLGSGWARLVDHLLQPKLPWRMLLAKYMSAVARDDYNYSRPSRREGEAILPSLRTSQIEVLVALDTSGSIQKDEMMEFVSEIDAIKGQVRARVTLLACDAQLAEGCPWEFEPWEEFSLPKDIKGGGGTRFTPVFEWAGKRDRAPDLLVYFTDAAGEFPKVEPHFPVLWLVKGKGTVPWGQRVQLN